MAPPTKSLPVQNTCGHSNAAQNPLQDKAVALEKLRVNLMRTLRNAKEHIEPLEQACGDCVTLEKRSEFSVESYNLSQSFDEFKNAFDALVKATEEEGVEDPDKERKQKISKGVRGYWKKQKEAEEESEETLE
jgi:hypothetical protein